MVPILRREGILGYLQGRDVVYLQELADYLDISVSTIRRDLQALEEEGEVVVMRGGAVRKADRDFDEPVTRKRLVNTSEKDVIAKKAAELVQDGDYIYIDSGTTTILMMKYLKSKNITVVTSSTMIMDYLPIKGVTGILLAGEIREDLQSVFGSLTEKLIMEMYFDKAFIGANGYVEGEGIYTYDPRESRKKEIVKENSKEYYVLIDTSKKNKKAFCKVCEYEECRLITEE